MEKMVLSKRRKVEKKKELSIGNETFTVYSPLQQETPCICWAQTAIPIKSGDEKQKKTTKISTQH